MDTRWPVRLFVEGSGDSKKNCSITFHFGESGHYTYETKIVNDNGTGLCCAMVVDTRPDNSNIRKYTATQVLLHFLYIFILCVCFV